MVGFGPGSGGVTFTATPTYQKGGMFLRSDLAVVHATSYAPGAVFGKTGTDANQFRAVLEFGFIFAITLPRNSGAVASAPQGDGKLNRRQSLLLRVPELNRQ